MGPNCMGPRHTRGHIALTIATLLVALASAALLTACGGSSGGASSRGLPSGSTSLSPTTATSAIPTPMPSPRIVSGQPPAGAVAVARRYWRLQSENRFDAARRLLAPDSPLLARWPGADALLGAHLVRARGPVLMKTLKAQETVQFPVDIYVVPKYPVGDWDGPGVYVQYMGFTRMSDGTWRVFETGTGP